MKTVVSAAHCPYCDDNLETQPELEWFTVGDVIIARCDCCDNLFIVPKDGCIVLPQIGEVNHTTYEDIKECVNGK